MTSKSLTLPTEQNALTLKQNIPIQLSDMSIFDNGVYALMKERFKREMELIEQQMNKFSSDLMGIYGETSTVQTATIVNATPHSGNSTGELPTATAELPPPTADWEVLKTSPLVIGEGKDKCLKLHFDVSQFDHQEINVKLLDNTLIVSASHEEKTADSTVYREYNRQFKLPPGIDPDLLVSTLSREGVLTVEVPLPPAMPPTDEANSFSECQ